MANRAIRKIQIYFEADTTEAQQKVAALNKQLQKQMGLRYEYELRVDPSKAASNVQSFERQLNAMYDRLTKRGKVHADTLSKNIHRIQSSLVSPYAPGRGGTSSAAEIQARGEAATGALRGRGRGVIQAEISNESKKLRELRDSKRELGKEEQKEKENKDKLIKAKQEYIHLLKDGLKIESAVLRDAKEYTQVIREQATAQRELNVVNNERLAIIERQAKLDQKRMGQQQQLNYVMGQEASRVRRRSPDDEFNAIQADVKRTDQMITSATSKFETDLKEKASRNRIAQVEMERKGRQGFRGQFHNAFKRVFMWGAAASVTYGAVREFQQLIKTIVTLESKLKELQRFMKDSRTGFAGLGMDVLKMSRNFGIASEEVVDGMTELAKQGFNREQIKERMKAALTMSAIEGEPSIKPAETVQYLTAVTEQYGDVTKDNMEIVDSWAGVAAKARVSMKDLADGVTKAGDSADSVGMGFHEMTALVGTLAESMKRSGTEIGNAWTFMFNKIRARSDELFEPLGIEYEDAQGKLRPFPELLGELAGMWDTLSREQQDNFAKVIGGSRRYQFFIATLKHYDKFLNNVSVSQKSQGEAGRQAGIVLASLSRQFFVLKQSITAFSIMMMNTGVIPLLYGLTKIVNTFLEVMLMLPPAVYAVIGPIGTLAAAFKLLDFSMNIWRNPKDTKFRTFTIMGDGLRSLKGRLDDFAKSQRNVALASTAAVGAAPSLGGRARTLAGQARQQNLMGAGAAAGAGAAGLVSGVKTGLKGVWTLIKAGLLRIGAFLVGTTAGLITVLVTAIAAAIYTAWRYFDKIKFDRAQEAIGVLEKIEDLNGRIAKQEKELGGHSTVNLEERIALSKELGKLYPDRIEGINAETGEILFQKDAVKELKEESERLNDTRENRSGVTGWLAENVLPSFSYGTGLKFGRRGVRNQYENNRENVEARLIERRRKLGEFGADGTMANPFEAFGGTVGLTKAIFSNFGTVLSQITSGTDRVAGKLAVIESEKAGVELEKIGYVMEGTLEKTKALATGIGVVAVAFEKLKEKLEPFITITKAMDDATKLGFGSQYKAFGAGEDVKRLQEGMLTWMETGKLRSDKFDESTARGSLLQQDAYRTLGGFSSSRKEANKLQSQIEDNKKQVKQKYDKMIKANEEVALHYSEWLSALETQVEGMVQRAATTFNKLDIFSGLRAFTDNLKSGDLVSDYDAVMGGLFTQAESPEERMMLFQKGVEIAEEIQSLRDDEFDKQQELQKEAKSRAKEIFNAKVTYLDFLLSTERITAEREVEILKILEKQAPTVEERLKVQTDIFNKQKELANKGGFISEFMSDESDNLGRLNFVDKLAAYSAMLKSADNTKDIWTLEEESFGIEGNYLRDKLNKAEAWIGHQAVLDRLSKENRIKLYQNLLNFSERHELQEEMWKYEEEIYKIRNEDEDTSNEFAKNIVRRASGLQSPLAISFQEYKKFIGDTTDENELASDSIDSASDAISQMSTHMNTLTDTTGDTMHSAEALRDILDKLDERQQNANMTTQEIIKAMSNYALQTIDSADATRELTKAEKERAETLIAIYEELIKEGGTLDNYAKGMTDFKTVTDDLVTALTGLNEQLRNMVDLMTKGDPSMTVHGDERERSVFSRFMDKLGEVIKYITGGTTLSARAHEQGGPADLVGIGGGLKLSRNAASSFAVMSGAAAKDGVDLSKIGNTFRTVGEQQVLWDDAVRRYGSEAAARKWVAPPGKSDHNRGRAIDFAWTSGGRKAANWMMDNAGNFGWQNYSPEWWHFGFKGNTAYPMASGGEILRDQVIAKTHKGEVMFPPGYGQMALDIIRRLDDRNGNIGGQIIYEDNSQIQVDATGMSKEDLGEALSSFKRETMNEFNRSVQSNARR